MCGTIEFNGGNIIASLYGIYNETGIIKVTGGNINASQTSSSTAYGIYNNSNTCITILGELDVNAPSIISPNITATSNTGTAYGLYANGTTCFYDGCINGSTMAIHGDVTELPEHYRIALKNNGKTAILEMSSDVENIIQFNGIFYDSLQAAVDAIAESIGKEGTITLWGDLSSLTDSVTIPENTKVTLALEGHSVQFQNLTKAITNNGVLTIVDFENVENSDEYTMSVIKNISGITIANNGTLVIGQDNNGNPNSPIVEGVQAVTGNAAEIKSGKVENKTYASISRRLDMNSKVEGKMKYLAGRLEDIEKEKLSSEVKITPNVALPDWTKNDVVVKLNGSVYGMLNLYIQEHQVPHKTIGYTVEYYKGGTKVEEDTIEITESVVETDPDTLTLDRTLINNNDKYEGYCIDRTEPVEVPDTINTGTVIKVYYKIDDTKMKELSYTVEYYKDEIKVEEDTTVVTEAVHILQPDTLTLNRALITNNNKYYGYCIDRVEPTEVPDTVNTGTTIQVYYKVDDTQTKTLRYTVEYYRGIRKVDADTVVRTETVQVLQPDTLIIDRTLLTNEDKYEGYLLNRTDPGEVPDEVNTGTIIKVYYELNDAEAKTLIYTIEYYKDEVKMEEDTVVITDRVYNAEPDTLPVDRSLIANNKYYGYCIDRTEPEMIPVEIDTGETIKVYYKVDETQTKTLSYTVEYYQGETKVDSDTIIKTETVQILQPDTLSIDRTLITDNDKYYGYCLDRTEPEEVPDTVDTGTIIKVYYEVDETQTKEIYYTVEYYKENVKVEEDTIIVRQTVQVLQPDTLSVDRTLITDNNKYLGYSINRTEPRNVPEVVNTETTIKVYYTLRNDLSYIVNYYKEGTTNKIEESKVARNQTYGTIVYAENEAKQIRGYKVVGYSEESITIGLEENVLDIYYALDDTQTKDIHYTVEYYKGTEKIEEDTVVRTEIVKELEAETLVVDKTLLTNNDKYEGYHLDRTDPKEVPEVVNNGTIIKVYYEKTEYTYRIEYYYNNQIDETLTEQGTAYLGDTIQECPSKPKEGYEFDRTENLPLEISSTRENVIRVYYVAVRKVTVEHIDKETEEVLEREVKVGKQGTIVKTEAKEIDGYRLVEKPAKEEYILGNEDIIVRYYYEKVKEEPDPTPREDEEEPAPIKDSTPAEPQETRTTDNTITTNKLPRTGYRRIIIPLVIVITMAGLVFYQKYQNVGKKKKKK